MHYESCIRIASGGCAQAGRTIAVARKAQYYQTVPFLSTINIDNIGERVAEDSGGREIRGFEIDVYNGQGEAACQGWRNRDEHVILLNY